jgi:hypothetical protein
MKAQHRIKVQKSSGGIHVTPARQDLKNGDEVIWEISGLAPGDQVIIDPSGGALPGPLTGTAPAGSLEIRTDILVPVSAPPPTQVQADYKVTVQSASGTAVGSDPVSSLVIDTSGPPVRGGGGGSGKPPQGPRGPRGEGGS